MICFALWQGLSIFLLFPFCYFYFFIYKKDEVYYMTIIIIIRKIFFLSASTNVFLMNSKW